MREKVCIDNHLLPKSRFIDIDENGNDIIKDK